MTSTLTALSALPLLKQEQSRGLLSPMMLFWGTPYTGKRTTALWLAGETLGIDFPLASPYFVTIGTLPRAREWRTLNALYRQKVLSLGEIKSFLTFFLRKFQPIFWEVSEIKSKISASDLRAIQDFVSYAQDATTREWEILEALVLKVVNLYTKGISIGQIRALKEWAFSLRGQPKFALIEGVHTLSTSSMNALLKLLEEPPSDFICVLTADNKNQLPQTLLSRLRSFSFLEYTREQVAEIVTTSFHTSSEAHDLTHFFSSWDKREREVHSFTQDFYFALQERDPFPRDLAWGELFGQKETSRDNLELFLSDLLALWQKRLHDYPAEAPLLTTLCTTLSQEAGRAFTFNQNPQTFLEGLYYRLKKIWIFEGAP